MQAVCITSVKQPLLQERRHTVRNHTIALHLSEPQSTVPRATLHRLPRQNLHRSSSTRVDLVVDHVLQALIVRWAEVYLRLEFATGVSVVHDF